MLRGLFEGAHYNCEAGAKCAVYSRARTKQGRGVIKEIRFPIIKFRGWLLGNHIYVKIFFIKCATWIYMVARYIC